MLTLLPLYHAAGTANALLPASPGHSARHSVTHSLIQSLRHSVIQSVTHSVIHSFSQSWSLGSQEACVYPRCSRIFPFLPMDL